MNVCVCVWCCDLRLCPSLRFSRCVCDFRVMDVVYVRDVVLVWCVLEFVRVCVYVRARFMFV